LAPETVVPGLPDTQAAVVGLASAVRSARLGSQLIVATYAALRALVQYAGRRRRERRL